MFKVKVKERIKEYCKDQIARYNFGMRSQANGTPEQQYTDILGQCTILDLLGKDIINGEDGCDDGEDLNFEGLSVDVKTMGRTTDVRPDFVNNFIALQMRFQTDLYIFCSLNKITEELTICGWIPKSEFIHKANFFPQGSIRKRTDGTTFKTFADLYEIQNTELYDVSSIQDMFNKIHDYYHHD